MKVRRWKYTDVAALAAFEKEQEFPDSWNYNMLAESFLNDGFYGVLAEEKGELIGMAAVMFGPDGADLVNILVKKDCRRRGVGDALMRAVLEECDRRELKKLFLEVRESNAPAVALYEKYGFTRVGERKKYYADGENAAVMCREGENP